MLWVARSHALLLYSFFRMQFDACMRIYPGLTRAFSIEALPRSPLRVAPMPAPIAKEGRRRKEPVIEDPPARPSVVHALKALPAPLAHGLRALPPPQAHGLSADEEIGALLLALLAQQGSYFQLHQFVQYHVVADALPLAAQARPRAPALCYLPSTAPWPI